MALLFGPTFGEWSLIFNFISLVSTKKSQEFFEMLKFNLLREIFGCDDLKLTLQSESGCYVKRQVRFCPISQVPRQ